MMVRSALDIQFVAGTLWLCALAQSTPEYSA